MKDICEEDSFALKLESRVLSKTTSTWTVPIVTFIRKTETTIGSFQSSDFETATSLAQTTVRFIGSVEVIGGGRW